MRASEVVPAGGWDAIVSIQIASAQGGVLTAGSPSGRAVGAPPRGISGSGYAATMRAPIARTAAVAWSGEMPARRRATSV